MEKVNLDEIDIEQLVAYEGFNYRLSNGNSGLQLNLQECPKCHCSDYKVYFNAETGFGNCFKCDAVYNKFSFVKAARRIGQNRDVFGYLSSIAGTVRAKPRVALKQSKVNLDWKLPLNKRIELDEDLPAYLVDRNIDAKISKRFNLRVCDVGFYQYTDFNEQTKFVDFSNRIIIPVIDIDGDLATFQGRDMTGKADKKYLFPNMLPGTARYIYNAHYCLKNKFKVGVLCEGAFDVFATTIALESDVGFKDYCALGTFGKHLSIGKKNRNVKDQLTDLMALKVGGVERFVLLWDGEAKAKLKAYETALLLKTYGLDCKVGFLPTDCDPAECSSQEVLDAIDNAFNPTPLGLATYRLTNETK